MKATEKLSQRIKKSQSFVCVGLDSDVAKLPAQFAKEKFPQFAFNKAIIDATHQYACAFKPNMAYYEAHGEQGVHELKMTIEYLQASYPDVFTICDAKRADIGPTNEGYVKSIFDWYGFDAVTLNPYPGKEALMPFLERQDKALIIWCRTSNPGAGEFQDLQIDGVPVWKKVAGSVAQNWNMNNNCMLVVGATYPEEMKEIREITGDMTFLAPGVGTQGGSADEVVKAGLNSHGEGLIINSSRGVIFASKEENFAEVAGQKAQELQQEINKAREKYARA